MANHKFGAVIFRNTFPQIAEEGGLWDSSEELYAGMGADSNKSSYWWTFPSGMRVRFRYLATETDKTNYLGAQIPLIGWDQLEQFSESTFFYLLSRNRSMSGVRGYMRGTCNPDADSWLARLLSWWIAEDGYADLSRAGKVRWFVRIGASLYWDDSPEPLLELDPEAEPKSLTFIPSTVYDNQILLDEDPGYLANLKALLPIDKERLLGHPTRGGNWKIKAGAGDIFNRDWFKVVNSLPPGGDACLFWDFAATEKETQSDDPDWTAAVLMIKVADRFFWADTITFREGPGQTMRRFENRSRQVAQEMQRQGRRFYLRWEIEPGSAAKRENETIMARFPDLDAEGIRSTGDKLVRARPLAQAAYLGLVQMLSSDWTEATLTHLHNQPMIRHDDIMDAGSGAYSVLVGDLLPEPAGDMIEGDADEILESEVRGQIFGQDRDRIFGRGQGRRGRRAK
jgi:phage terminase large subunit-like protein